MHFPFRGRRRVCRGSALSLAIIVSVILSSLIAALAYVAGQSAQATGTIAKMDQAFFAAESGAQRLAWCARNRSTGTLASPLVGVVNGFSYKVSWPQGTLNGVQVTSAATSVTGNASYSLSMFCSPSYSPAPAFTSFGNFDNKNTIIVGDVATNGSYSSAGSGQLEGDLYYAGSAVGLSDVTGIIYPAATFPSLDFAGLDTMLRAAALTLPPATPIFDFTTAPGINKVIYVVGDVTDPNFASSGTLYVKGKVHFTNPNVVVGSSIKPVTIVATDDITFDKAATVYGGLYTPKNIYRAQLDITGSVYAGATLGPSNSGVSHFTVGALPWFDNRTIVGPQTSLTFTNFTGIMP